MMARRGKGLDTELRGRYEQLHDGSQLRNLNKRTAEIGLRNQASLVDLKSQLVDQLAPNKPVTHCAVSILSNLDQAANTIRTQLRILESLKYQGMRDREHGIVDAHANTFNWITLPSERSPYPDVKFVEWLEHGEGIYWISGAPGCGKSVMMKSVTSHLSSEAKLRIWDGKGAVVVARHFFESGGSELQNSLEGLLRSLLLGVFSERPDMIPVLCGDRWSDAEQRDSIWTIGELMGVVAALQLSMRAAHSSERELKSRSLLTQPEKNPTEEKLGDRPRICFFVDGLDECIGHRERIIRFIANMAKCPNFKVCVATRNIPKLSARIDSSEDASPIKASRCLKLTEFNTEDVLAVVRGTFGRDEKAMSSQHEDMISINDLAVEISKRSGGVFLWASLVCQELIRGLANWESVDVLHDRLKSIPQDLEDYLRWKVLQVPKDQQAVSAKLLLVMSAGPNMVPLATARGVFETSLETMEWNLRQSKRRGSEPTRNALELCQPHQLGALFTKLSIAGAGVLEVRTINSRSGGHMSSIVLELAHEAVRDFLLTKEMQDLLQARLEGRFNLDEYLCLASLDSFRRQPANIGVLVYTREWDDALKTFGVHFASVLGKNPERDRRWLDIASWIANHRLAQGLDVYQGMDSSTAQEVLTRDAFLPFAVWHGYSDYVAAKLDECPSLFRKANLLELTLLPRYVAGRKNFRFDVNMVRLLISHGSSPNHACRGGTTWLHFLNDLKGKWAEFADRKGLVETIEALLLAGASMATTIQFDENGYASLVSPAAILRDLLNDEEQARIEPLVSCGVRQKVESLVAVNAAILWQNKMLLNGQARRFAATILAVLMLAMHEVQRQVGALGSLLLITYFFGRKLKKGYRLGGMIGVATSMGRTHVRQ
jgi:hypothetical protein